MDRVDEKKKKIVCDLFYDEIYVPMKFKELAMLLQIPKEKRDELRRILEELEAEGKIYLSKRGKYCRGEAQRITGTYRANQKGFGFVTVPESESDIYISEDNTGGAFDQDEVEVVLTKTEGTKNREGKIVRILSRGITRVVGLYEKRQGREYGFVLPDNQKILKDVFIPAGMEKGAVNGQKVVAELTSYGEDGRKPEGRIVEIIGHVSDPLQRISVTSMRQRG